MFFVNRVEEDFFLNLLHLLVRPLFVDLFLTFQFLDLDQNYFFLQNFHLSLVKFLLKVFNQNEDLIFLEYISYIFFKVDSF